MTSSPSAARSWPRRGRLLRGAVASAATLLAVAAGASSAQANIEFDSLSVQPTTNPRTADPTVAGSHPNMEFQIQIRQDNPPDPPESLRTMRITLPRGLVFNPQALSTLCPPVRLFADDCPRNSQIGMGFALEPGGGNLIRLWAMPPTDNEAARFGITTGTRFGGYIMGRVTPEGEYRIRADIPEVSRQLDGLVTIRLVFWGTPQDFQPGPSWLPLPNPPGSDPPKPFISYPTRCDEPLVTEMTIDSYETPGVFDTATSTAPMATQCDTVPFDANLRVQPLGRTAGGAAPVEVDINVTQSDDPDVRSTATLEDATVVLPEGLTINPGIAHDLSGCDDAAFGKSSGAPSACPAGSKIGTVGIQTPLLPDPIPGEIYVGQPKPGKLFRLFIYANGQGARIKLEGDIQVDPNTGRVSAIFNDNPPLPFSTMRLRFRGGGQAVLGLPESCGPKTAIATFTPPSVGASVFTQSTFQVYADEAGTWCPDPQPFGPSFQAGTTSAQAGADTGFSMTFGRPSNHQHLGGVQLDLPAGLLGRLTAVPLCPAGQAAAGTCGEESLVGGVTASAGAGDSVVNLPGRAYLTEPLGAGQIAGLSIVVPAVVGPYDLGTVVVKAGIRVNRDTSLSVDTDPLPKILQGIPLRIRQVTVTLDRPGFMFNPTDCSPKSIAGRLTSVDGAESAVGNPFQVQGCSKLPFEPKLEMSTTQPSKEGGTTGLHVKITPQAGDANMRVVDLILPSGMGARLEGPLQNPCTGEQLAQEACPDASLVGSASAHTPVLPQPLSGKVHLLENASGGGLPRLAILLRGAVPVDLIGDITVNSEGRLVAHVPGVPDVPISSFEMDLATGEQAVLTASGLCSGEATAYRSITAHSGKQLRGTIPVEVAGCSKASTSKKAKSKRKKGNGKKGAKRN